MAATAATTAANLNIVNMALARIGAERLASYPDIATKNGKIINGADGLGSVYIQTIKEVLRMNPWACSITRGAFTNTARTTPPAGDFTYSAAFPTATPFCVRVLDIGGDKNIPFRIEGSTILHNITGATLVVRFVGYASDSGDTTYYQPDPTAFDPILVEAVVTRLASKIAHVITGNPQISQMLMQDYMIALAAAKSVAVVETKEDVADILGFWTDVKYAMAKPRNEVSE